MIFITGSTGYVGRHLIPELIKNKYKLRCLVRKTSNVGYLKKYKNIEIVYGDITDKNSLSKTLKDIKVVIHLAAVISSSNKKLLYKVNYEGCKNLLEGCKKNKIKRIIVISSMAAAKKHLDDYGKSKLMADELFLNSNLDFTILRPTLIYGKDSESLKRVTNFIRKIPLITPIIGNGNYKIQPVHINDVIYSIIKCIDNKKSIGKIYEILGREDLTFSQFIDTLTEKMKMRKFKIYIPINLCLYVISTAKFLYPKFPINKSMILSINKSSTGNINNAVKDLNYNPVSFKEGLNDI